MNRDSTLYLGLDIGQANDYSAVAVVQADSVLVGERVVRESRQARPYGQSRLRVVRVEEVQPEYAMHYQLRWLERLPLGMSYPRQVQHIVGLVRRLADLGRVEVVADRTGVGRAVIDALRVALPGVIAISITGGMSASWAGPDVSVPKRDLIATLVLLLQSGRLRIAEGLALGPILVQELLAFRMKVSLAGHDSYEAWRENQHDDLVLATSLAVWLAEDRAGNAAWGRSYEMTR
jgi:hypothetical protein